MKIQVTISKQFGPLVPGTYTMEGDRAKGFIALAQKLHGAEINLPAEIHNVKYGTIRITEKILQK